jgi:DinB family protein
MHLSNSIKTRLQFQHETIRELSTDFSEEELKVQVIRGKWSAFENVVHLISYQPTFINRIALMLKEDEPVFERYVAENDPLFNHYLEKDLPELFTILNYDRATLIINLQNIPEEQLIRTGKHLKFGTLTIAQWTEMFLLHEAHHLWTMLGLINSLRADVKK